MAPILIDNRGLIKLGLISVCITASVFAIGFYNGFQQASEFYLAGSETESLTLPEQAILAESELEPQSPENTIAGEEIDVDFPQLENKDAVVANVVPNVIDPVIEAAAINKVAINQAARTQTIKPLDNPAHNENNKSTEEAVLVIKKVTTLTENKAQVKEPAVIETPYLAVDVSSLSLVELNKINYSVQVGMYGRLVNAENMVKLLHAQQFDAYVSDYTNKKDEIRYNVRFGYFADKKSALSALKKYKNARNGDGYLVKFSIDSMTKVAKTDDSKALIETETTLEKLPENDTPVKAMTNDGEQKNISQLTNSNQSLTLAQQ